MTVLPWLLMAAPIPAHASGVFEIGLQGRVATEEGRGLGGTTVRAYADGMAIASAAADDSGAYRLEFEVDEGDRTIVVFFIPQRSHLVPEVAIITESKRDRALGLWGPCVPRIGLLRRSTYDPILRTPADLRRRLAQTGCAGHRGP